MQELCGGEGAAGAASTTSASGGPGTGSSAAAGLPALPRVRDMADVVCAEALEPYLALELRWLAGLYEARAAALGRGSGLSMELLLYLLAANEEVRGDGREEGWQGDVVRTGGSKASSGGLGCLWKREGGLCKPEQFGGSEM